MVQHVHVAAPPTEDILHLAPDDTARLWDGRRRLARANTTQPCSETATGTEKEESDVE